MVKAERGSRYTDSEGRQRGGLRNPEIRRLVREGKASPSSEVGRTKNSKAHNEERRKDYALLETMIHYFDEEWFDLDSDKRQNQARTREGNKVSYEPVRCDACGKGWVNYKVSKDGGHYYLEEDLFKNIPLNKKTCPDC